MMCVATSKIRLGNATRVVSVTANEEILCCFFFNVHSISLSISFIASAVWAWFCGCKLSSKINLIKLPMRTKSRKNDCFSDNKRHQLIIWLMILLSIILKNHFSPMKNGIRLQITDATMIVATRFQSTTMQSENVKTMQCSHVAHVTNAMQNNLWFDQKKHLEKIHFGISKTSDEYPTWKYQIGWKTQRRQPNDER